MKVLLVNKFHWNKGGAEKYYFELGQLLKENGHEVAYFSMEDKRNIITGGKEYFVPNCDFDNVSMLRAFDIIYNKKNGRIMAHALDEFKPDIVHLNNFQRQLSSSIIKPIIQRNIPIIYTAHDYQALCPAISMLDNESTVCEKCIGGKYENCIYKSCIKGSRLRSILGAIEAVYYRYTKIYRDKIDHIITPANFSTQKFIEDGFQKDKVTAIHNSIDIDEYRLDTEDNGYILYFGRLSREKGIYELLDAFSKCHIGKLCIAGDGPERNKIEKMVKTNNLNIDLLGKLDKHKMREVIAKCRFVVVPSVWYENCSYVLLEALAIGKAVIGSNIGGIPELLKDGLNGLLYNNKWELTEKMQLLYEDDNLLKTLQNNALQLPAELINRQIYYDRLMKIYREQIKKHNTKAL